MSASSRAIAFSQIGVEIVLGSISTTDRSSGSSSCRHTSAIASIANFEACVGAERTASATLAADRADEHDPPAGRAQQRQRRLRDGHLTDDVDLELRGAGRRVGSASSGPWTPIPALFTRPSSLPSSSIAAAIDAASVTSRASCCSRPEPPASASSPSPTARTPANTSIPAASNRSAVAAPMPVDAPVISTRVMVRGYPERERAGAGVAPVRNRRPDPSVLSECSRPPCASARSPSRTRSPTPSSAAPHRSS